MEYFYLAAIGLFAGVISGIFGIGGGTITVPSLLMVGFSIKYAIGISVMQMFASSLFGSWINSKKEFLKVKESWFFGIGGIIGGTIGGNFLDLIPENIIKILFLALIFYAFIKVFFSTAESSQEPKVYPLVYILIGVCIGVISGMLGVGGAIILIPLLMNFFNFGVKKAIASGLFFVMFTSTASFLTLLYLGYVDLIKGGLVAFFSLFGVRFGIFLGEKLEAKKHKKLIAAMYAVLFLIVAYKLFVWENN